MPGGRLIQIGIGICALATLIATTAHADDEGIVIWPAISVRQSVNNGAGDQTDYLMDISAGYRLGSGWYFGMTYASTVSNGAVSANEYGIGNTFAYFDDGFFFAGTIFLVDDRVEKTATSYISWSEGLGTQFEIGYFFPTTFGFSIAPELLYRTITFGSEDQHTGATISASHSETLLYPFLAFSVVF